MPTLLDLQHAMCRSLVARDDEEVAAMLADHVARNRLDIYRNTFVSGLAKALRHSYPVVHRLVGAEFFDAAAELFITQHPPGTAYLDLYGGEFCEFLRSFQPAASLAYLADVARLEWAVNRAIHALDREPLELAKLAAIAPADQGRVCFVAHPCVSLLRADYPVDVIWRAVLDGDDETLASLDVGAGPVHLLIERDPNGVEVARLREPEWNFLAGLCAGRPLQSALDQAADLDVAVTLAEHLVAGRFVAFELTASDAMTALHAAAV